MNRYLSRCLGVLALGWFSGIVSGAEGPRDDVHDLAEVLAREWSLGKVRSPGTRCYTLENVNTDIASDGTRAAPTTYRLWMEVDAAVEPAGEPLSIRCVCRQATISTGEEPPRRVPAFEGYEYELHLGVDSEDQLFGIPHADFNGLVDDAGEPLGMLEGFMLYGSFVDFHMFDTFTAGGQGEFHSDLSTLRRLGQQHTTEVGIEVPIHLEPSVLEGSRFRNGTISFAFKGVTLAAGAPCALIDIASRDGSFELILAPQPGLRMKAVGGSVYSGEFYLELDSQWMHRLDFREFVVSRITMGPQEVGSGVTERCVSIRSVAREVFEDSLE